jgi:hypothetical protein
MTRTLAREYVKTYRMVVLINWHCLLMQQLVRGDGVRANDVHQSDCGHLAGALTSGIGGVRFSSGVLSIGSKSWRKSLVFLTGHSLFDPAVEMRSLSDVLQCNREACSGEPSTRCVTAWYDDNAWHQIDLKESREMKRRPVECQRQGQAER